MKFCMRPHNHIIDFLEVNHIRSTKKVPLHPTAHAYELARLPLLPPNPLQALRGSECEEGTQEE